MRRLIALVCVIVWLTGGGIPWSGSRAQAMAGIAPALEGGAPLRFRTSFQWNGFPLWDDETNAMFKSLLGATMVQTRMQKTEDRAYLGLDLLLQGASVVDLSMWHAAGQYYEQSNLLGGYTLALTPEALAAAVGSLLSLFDGVSSDTLVLLLDVLRCGMALESAAGVPVARAAGGTDWAAWRDATLSPTERLQPPMHLPGLYGARAEVVAITRDEMIALVDACRALLSAQTVGWFARPSDWHRNVAAADDSANVAWLQALSDSIADRFDPDTPVLEYGTVYDWNGAIAAYQLSIRLADDIRIQLEWSAAQAESFMLYGCVQMGDMQIDALLTRYAVQARTGNPGGEQRAIAQFRYTNGPVCVDGTITHRAASQTTAGKTRSTAHTELMMEGLDWLGMDVPLLLCVDTEETTSGEGNARTGKRESTVRLKGLGFDSRKILTITTRMIVDSAWQPASAVIAQPDALLPDAGELSAALQQHITQVLYTIIGRLPPTVAAYFLERLP